MKLVITSHIKGSIALKHILDSLSCLDTFKDIETIVAIGGYYDNKDYEIEKKDNITYIKCNHNSIDYTAMIALAELYSQDENEYYFYVHDTCKAGPDFLNKIRSIDLTNVSSIKLDEVCSKSMGVYSQKIINKFKDFLMTKKNISESRLMEFKVNCHEDYIFQNDPLCFALNNRKSMDFTGPVNYYGTGIPRYIVHFENVDLYKIQANYGVFWTLDN